MATIHEMITSRDGTYLGKSPDNVLRYQVLGTDDDLVASSMVDGGSPAEYGGLIKQSYRISPGEGPEVWYGEVQYGPFQPGTPNDDVGWQLEIGGGTQHITNALVHRNSYSSAGALGVDHWKGAIGCSKNNGEITVDGVDIESSSMEWSETHWMYYDFFTPAYMTLLFNMNKHVNTYAWRIFAAGEVLFRGVSVQTIGTNRVSLTFKFAASPNVTGLTVGSVINVAKFGWDHAWVEYAPTVASNRHLVNPLGVHVEQVYYGADFRLLGLSNNLSWNA